MVHRRITLNSVSATKMFFFLVVNTVIINYHDIPEVVVQNYHDNYHEVEVHKFQALTENSRISFFSVSGKKVFHLLYQYLKLSFKLWNFNTFMGQ